MVGTRRSRAAVACGLGVLLVASGPVAGLGPAQARSSSRCQAAGSTTVVANRVARVYRVALQEPGHVRYFACAYARGRTFHLAESRFVGEDTYGAVELAGNALAYSVALACRRCENSYARVYVHDVRSGRVTARTAAVSLAYDAEISSEVRSLVLRRNGAAAWIASVHPHAYPATGDIEVMKLEGGRRTLLDTGPKIDVTSLKLSGASVSWTNDGEAKQAKLR